MPERPVSFRVAGAAEQRRTARNLGWGAVWALSLLVSLMVAASDALAEPPDLRFELVRHSLTGDHCRYRVYEGGLPTDDYVTRSCLVQRGQVERGAGPSVFGLSEELPPDTKSEGLTPSLRSVFGRPARRVIVEERPFQPYALDYDLATGALLRRIPLFFEGKPARVFDPNPVASLDDPSLQDENNGADAVPEEAYRAVELEGVEEGTGLRGPYASLVDRQLPSVPPPDASGSLVFDRSMSGFEDVNAYFHIDATQRYLQSLGYVGDRSIAAYSIEIDAHAASGVDNSFFIPSSTRVGRGTLFFGDGGTDDAEDADLVVHEYGHAILEWIAPGTFAGAFSSQARAVSEGFGDYWAFSAHADARRVSGRNPFCFADWDARCWEDDSSQQCGYAPGSDCLRRLDSAHTMADYDTSDVPGTEHRNGTIWSSALREIHDIVSRRVADAIVIESLFGVPPNPTYAVMGRRMIEADRLLYGGAHAGAICAAMLSRSILADCQLALRSDLTLFQSPDRGIPIPDSSPTGITASLTIDDPRTIESVFVRVDIAHSARGDLRIELVAPDGTTILLKQVAFETTPDVHATFGLTAAPVESLDILRGRSAAGVWQLRVSDLRSRDVGVLLSWGLVVRFEGTTPVETRPSAEKRQMIPVVTHVFGVDAVLYASDLRIANPSASPVTATLIFTRSGEDGSASFASVEVALEAGETVAFDDVVESIFLTVGSGSLEVLGDVDVMSRTYIVGPSGTKGEQVPPNLRSTTLGGAPLFAMALPLPGFRLNLGLTETGGGAGIVRVTLGDAGEEKELSIAPFSHLQMGIDSNMAEIHVVSGDATVAAYISEIDAASDDAMFIPAISRMPAPVVMAPAISSKGVRGRPWQSDLWMADSQPSLVSAVDVRYLTGDETVELHFLPPVSMDVVATGFGRPNTIGAIAIANGSALVANTRIATDGVSQFVPFVVPDGPPEQHLLFIESSDAYRTNIGILADGPAVAEVGIFDAGGHEIEHHRLATRRGLAQLAVGSRVIHGRAVVRFLSGRGRAYASLVDNASGDATYVDGR